MTGIGEPHQGLGHRVPRQVLYPYTLGHRVTERERKLCRSRSLGDRERRITAQSRSPSDRDRRPWHPVLSTGPRWTHLSLGHRVTETGSIHTQSWSPSDLDVYTASPTSVFRTEICLFLGHLVTENSKPPVYFGNRVARGVDLLADLSHRKYLSHFVLGQRGLGQAVFPFFPGHSVTGNSISPISWVHFSDLGHPLTGIDRSHSVLAT